MFRPRPGRSTFLPPLLLVFAAGCQSQASRAVAPEDLKIPSTEIMKRTAVTDKAVVKHILVGWRDLAEAYGGQLDSRAASRTREEAGALATELFRRALEGEEFEALMREYSEDPGSAEDGGSYTATPDASLVPPFKHLCLRLQVGEAGVVRSDYGWHVIQRVE